MDTITISVEEYKRLVEAAREGEMLKAIIFERAESYLKLENPELRMLKTLFGGNESEE